MATDIPRSSNFLLLDGAVTTNMQIGGMPDGVCQEEWILNNPDVLTALQRDFIASGSDVIYTPTFGANRGALARFFGDEEETAAHNRVVDYNIRLTELSRRARELSGKSEVKIAGCLSPTGFEIEPFGETPFCEVVQIFSEQASALIQGGVDIFVIDTMTSLAEARAAVFACREFEKEIFVTLTVNQEGKTESGAAAVTALVALQELGVSAFGLSCSGEPEIMEDELAEAAEYANIPLIAKPNAGEPNMLIPTLYDLSPECMENSMKKLLDAGASYIGGCCGTTPQHIARMRGLLDGYAPSFNKQAADDGEIILSNETDIFVLEESRIEFSESVFCEFDMSDALLDIEDDSVDVISVVINSPDEAYQFALNAHFASLPVCILASDVKTLERALYLYVGRALVDRNSDIEESELQTLCRKYGAVLY